LPEIGWTGYDPTLGEATSGSHVVTGVSNHPRGVMPITGTFFGKQVNYLGMTVAVQTERLAHAPNPKPPELSESATAGAGHSRERQRE
jgi:transglutaminase-like putative cysteine protease